MTAENADAGESTPVPAALAVGTLLAAAAQTLLLLLAAHKGERRPANPEYEAKFRALKIGRLLVYVVLASCQVGWCPTLCDQNAFRHAERLSDVGCWMWGAGCVHYI